MEFAKVTPNLVMAEMDRQQPNWWLSWADQQDLKDALQTNPLNQADFLRARCTGKVMLAVRSAYSLTVRKD